MLGNLINYSFIGDISTIVISLVIIVLLATSYVSHTKSYTVFLYIVGDLIVSAGVNILLHALLLRNDPSLYSVIYALRILYHALVLGEFFLFTIYAAVVSGMNKKKAHSFALISSAMLFTMIAMDIIILVRSNGFGIANDGMSIQRSAVFTVGYILYIILILFMMLDIRRLLYKRVMWGFYGTMLIAVAFRILQIPFNQASLTTISFVLPVIAMMYIMHSNPYNIKLGAVDLRAMEEMVKNMYENNQEFMFMSLLLPEYNEEDKEVPESIRTTIRHFSEKYFRNCTLFQIGNGHMIIMERTRKGFDYEAWRREVLDAFRWEYSRFKISYKIVIGSSIDEISMKNEYVSLLSNVYDNMEDNTIYRISDKDVARFNRDKYILSELTDIYNKRDLNDPRVLTYCQPVYNIKTGTFDTAEALMRLELDRIGIVPPDLFIPIAENHGYIHVLTEIILNKTCREIRSIMDEGKVISRVSVNVSALEVKDDNFCADMNKIILDNNIPFGKVAIELTETRTQKDFMIMKSKIEELSAKGIKFYLDDFGTGYSNMERIMELPFDIIKFDRSLVLLSREDERSEKIVDNLANMFRDMEYSVLYEGVEDEADEERCREMSASYLQGFKYSRPVPIRTLRDYLSESKTA